MTSLFENFLHNMGEIVYSHKEKPMLHYNGFCCHFHSFNNKDSSKGYWCCEDTIKIGECNAQCTLARIWITFKMGKKNISRKMVLKGGKLRKTLNKLKHAEEPNVTPSLVLRRVYHDIYDKDILLMLPETH